MAAEYDGHVPVLLEEVMAALEPRDGAVYLDCTFGRGGHAAALLGRAAPTGRVIALDRDPQAVRAGQEMARHEPRLSVMHEPFNALADVAARTATAFDGVLFDLGVSSPQIDDPARGFSFRFDGPLDMRMDTTRGESAAHWIARAGEAEMTRVLREYGEERFAGRIVRAIVAARAESPIDTTRRLAEIVASAVPARSRRSEPTQHPATRTFQAVRIRVNEELSQLEEGLAGAVECLAPGGRIAVISFHSLEDRIVKRFFRARSNPPRPSRHLPLPVDSEAPVLRVCGKAVRAGEDEVARNPRARSAVLRVAEKLA